MRILAPFVSLVTIAALLVTTPVNSVERASASSTGDRILPGSVPAAVSSGSAQLLGARLPSDVLSFTVTLSVRNQAALLQFLHDLNDPRSPSYHQPLSLARANSLFNPTADQEQQVVSWLQSSGFTATRTYPNHLLVDARGTVAQVEATFHVAINEYRAIVRGKEVTFSAPAQDPTVPAAVGGIVRSIVGLDTYPRFFVRANGLAHGSPPYFPQDFANAYDLNPLWNAGYTGAGQHIGITLWTVPPSSSTLSAFASASGAAVATSANGRLKVIPVDGGSTAADQGEAGMDIEYSSGMAPGATIDYYEAPTDATGNPTGQGLIDALNLAGTDANNNRQISSSWGGCEATTALDPFTSSAEQVFASNAATGHNYFFSSGDNGSYCTAPSTGAYVSPLPDYPASSPNVTSVGGTRFNGNVAGTWPGESAWTFCTSCNSGAPAGSGGGYSTIFNRPAWQTGAGLAGNGKRGYPDISATADPSTGAYVCYGNSSACAQFGGTSLASPLWAGLTAIFNQYLAARGKPSLGFLTPTLYSLATAPQTYVPFHDITSGTNGAYSASAGWDAVTGEGTPDAWNIARDVAGSSGLGSSPTPTTVPAPTSTPTGTPKPIATPTRTATPLPTHIPTPTATPSAGSSLQLVVNGSFENGRSPWSEYSRNGFEIIDSTRPHTGSYSAYLCGYSNCLDQIWQFMTLPASITSATLTYWIYVDTQDATACADKLTVQVSLASGSALYNAPQVCNANTGGWVQKAFNLTSVLASHPNQQIRLLFQGTTGSGPNTDFFVDDVTLTVSIR